MRKRYKQKIWSWLIVAAAAGSGEMIHLRAKIKNEFFLKLSKDTVAVTTASVRAQESLHIRKRGSCKGLGLFGKAGEANRRLEL